MGKDLADNFPGIRIRYNYPYRGTADGMTSYLRKRFAARTYLGIVIELNQEHIIARDKFWHDLQSSMGVIINNALSQIHKFD